MCQLTPTCLNLSKILTAAPFFSQSNCFHCLVRHMRGQETKHIIHLFYFWRGVSEFSGCTPLLLSVVVPLELSLYSSNVSLLTHIKHFSLCLYALLLFLHILHFLIVLMHFSFDSDSWKPVFNTFGSQIFRYHLP